MAVVTKIAAASQNGRPCPTSTTPKARHNPITSRMRVCSAPLTGALLVDVSKRDRQLRAASSAPRIVMAMPSNPGSSPGIV